jgi:hypothetical protein
MTGCGLGKQRGIVTENKGDECSSLEKNRKASSQDFFRVRHQGKPGRLNKKGQTKNDFNSRKGKTSRPGLRKERETGQGYRLRY